MMLETSHTISTDRYGNCENCGFHTKLSEAKENIGSFFGKPVHGDVWLCQLCIDTWTLRRGMEKDKTMKLMIYLTNAIIERVDHWGHL